MKKLKLKKGDRVWANIPINAIIKSVDKKRGYILKEDDGTEYYYYDDSEVQKVE